MTRKRAFWAITAMGLFLATVACAPTPPTPATPSAKQTAVPSTPTSNITPRTSQEDAAWNKVVEAARKEGKVTAYSYTWVGDIGSAVSKAFQDKYGIRLEILAGRGAEFQERLKTERRVRQQIGDMTEGSSAALASMKADGLLTSVVSELPSFREQGVWLVDPTATDPQDKTNLAYRIIEYAPYINTKLVKPEQIPSSWKDLLDPKWTGKMSLIEPSLNPGIYQTMVVLMDNKVWDEDYVKALYRQKLRFNVSEYEDLRSLAAGEAYLTVKSADGTAAPLALDKAPIQAIDMKEGVVVTTSSAGAITGAPNPNAAKVLLNWMFSPEGQSVLGRAQSNKMVRKGVEDFRPKAVQVNMTHPLVITSPQLDRATALYRDKWFDKLVGR